MCRFLTEFPEKRKYAEFPGKEIYGIYGIIRIFAEFMEVDEFTI